MSSPTLPFGPNTQSRDGVLNNPTNISYPTSTGAADIVVSSIFSSGIAQSVYFNSAGMVYIQFRGDAAGYASPYTVVAGTKINGNIVLIGGTTNYGSATSGLSMILEA
jgi:hypothetical protein